MRDYDEIKAEYEFLIKKIRFRRRLVVALTIIAFFAVLLFTTPMYVELMGEVIVDYKGLPMAVTVILVICCFIFELIAYAAVSIPINNAIDRECDPEKSLILNMELNKSSALDHIYATDYLYLGEYDRALVYCEKMISSSREPNMLAGLMHKARCEFLRGNIESLKECEAKYAAVLSQSKKKESALIPYQKIHINMKLMCASADNDVEVINELRNPVEPWSPLKLCEEYVNYLKGLAAFAVDDREEAVYRLKSVCDRCPKTVFAKLANEKLNCILNKF